MFADEGDRGRKFCKASQVRINSLMFYDIGLHSFIKALVQITEYIQRTSLTKFLRLSKSLQAELSFRDVQSFTGQVKIQIGFFDVFVRLSFCTLLGSKLVISNVDKTVMPTTADLVYLDLVKISHCIREVYTFAFGGNSSAVSKIKVEQRNPNEVLVDVPTAQTQSVISVVKPATPGCRRSTCLSSRRELSALCKVEDWKGYW
jgi:hypothetical protein